MDRKARAIDPTIMFALAELIAVDSRLIMESIRETWSTHLSRQAISTTSMLVIDFSVGT